MTAFAWDRDKEIRNILKHEVNFETAKQAFKDPDRIIIYDPGHSSEEARFFCYGKVSGQIITVRFTYRGNYTRIIGAGYWRKGKDIYEKKKKILRRRGRFPR